MCIIGIMQHNILLSLRICNILKFHPTNGNKCMSCVSVDHILSQLLTYIACGSCFRVTMVDGPMQKMRCF